MNVPRSRSSCYFLLFSISICFILVAFCAKELAAIETPKGTTVPNAFTRAEMTQSDIDYWNNWATNTYPNAVFQGNSSRTYNCHAYAWHVSEGSGHIWINAPGQETYWTDGSYGEVSSESEATKVSYASDDHSAITTNQTGWFISKWGATPLMKHAWNDCPYDASQIKYYAITFNVVHPPTAPAVNSNFVVAVKNWTDPSMVPNASVELIKDNQVIDTKMSADTYPDKGTASFSYSLTPGTMMIRVRKDKYSEYEGTCSLSRGIAELWISLHGGATRPYDEWYETTFCFNSILNLEYHFSLRWAAVLEVAYNDFKWRDPNQHFPWWNISTTIRHYYPSERVIPFINFGPGIYLPDEGNTRFGTKIGLGLDFAVSEKIRIEVGSDYHYILAGNELSLNQDTKTSFQHFHAGITYRLRGQNKGSE